MSGLLQNLIILSAHAQSAANVGGPSVSTNIQNPAALVNAVYNYAFAIGGLLAFGAVVYGAVRLTFSAGNPSAQSDARDQITQALLGLALLLGAYTVLNTISPNLVNLKLPSLEKVRIPTSTVPAPGPGGWATCASTGQCKNSAAVDYLLANLPAPYKGITATTYQGEHHLNSCHFGGRTCTDGSHAVDWGKNALSSKGLTMQNMIDMAERTGPNAVCRCESANGGAIVGCENPAANHVHCNVDASGCGCN